MHFPPLATLCLALAACSQAQPPQDTPPSTTPPPELPVALGQGLDPAPLELMASHIMADSFPRTTSVLILRRDTLVYEGYFGYGDADLLNDTRSATKSLTALAIGTAVDDGLLSTDDPVFDHLTDLEPFQHDGPVKRAITVADLLTMSSALDCNDNDPSSPGNEENMYPLRRWARWAADIPVDEGYARGDDGRGRFSYCTGGSFLLGQVLERVTGMTLDDYFAERLFHPLGIEVWQWARSPTGEYMTGGGLRLRSRDLGLLGAMVLNGGEFRDIQIVSPAWADEATRAHVQPNEDQEYGYQFWRRTWTSPCGPQSAAYMSGNGGNAILMVPELEAVIVVTRQNYGTRGMHQQTMRIVENYAMPALCAG